MKECSRKKHIYECPERQFMTERKETAGRSTNLTEKLLYSKSSWNWVSACPTSFEHKHSTCVMPKYWRVCTDLAASAPPINKLPVIDEGLSVFAASVIKAVLSRMCSSLTCRKFQSLLQKEKSVPDTKFLKIHLEFIGINSNMIIAELKEPTVEVVVLTVFHNICFKHFVPAFKISTQLCLHLLEATRKIYMGPRN